MDGTYYNRRGLAEGRRIVEENGAGIPNGVYMLHVLFQTYFLIPLKSPKARYNNKEYVLTQPFDSQHMSLSAVKVVLMAELKFSA